MCGLRFLGGFLKKGRGRDSTIFFFFFGPKLLRKLTGNCLAGRTDIAMCVCVCVVV